MDKIEKLSVLKVTECSKDWEYYINRSERKLNELVEGYNELYKFLEATLKLRKIAEERSNKES